MGIGRLNAEKPHINAKNSCSISYEVHKLNIFDDIGNELPTNIIFNMLNKKPYVVQK